MSWLNALLERRFPDGAQVTRCEFRDAYRVTVIIPEREVIMAKADPGSFARDTLRKLTPTERVRRRLHWGKKH